MTLLWICFTVFASVNGAMVEMDATLGFLLAQTIVPLVAMPISGIGADPTEAVAGIAGTSIVHIDQECGQTTSWLKSIPR